MKRSDIVSRVRSLTRDFSASIYREVDINDFINEAIDRIKQVIYELDGMVYLTASGDEPTLLPTKYHHLLAIYASARCFSQDEQHYQGTSMMNEFEVKLNELNDKIQSGEIIIVDSNNVAITNTNEMDFVETDSYWGDYHTGDFTSQDIDLGVEGVDS